jgi:lipid-A-disaccharide synthase
MASPAFMFVAGDPSGDQNTAPIIRQLRRDLPDCTCYGIGGPMMQTEGFISFLPFEEFNRMGYVEVLTHLSFFLKAKKLLIREMKERKPDCVVCVDYSGFNTQIMKAAHGLGIPVLWYIAPKIWAWKKKKHTTNLQKYVSKRSYLCR